MAKRRGGHAGHSCDQGLSGDPFGERLLPMQKASAISGMQAASWVIPGLESSRWDRFANPNGPSRPGGPQTSRNQEVALFNSVW